ncbi:prostaglandin F2-alpha receptor-like isoform X2 [Narcine bancroftii]|uniref:prostaglandin F2-alpha receptor-like isoform X2 n=1 Tax=Narcine bancroftii TaxID=1343680 RepID=UPI00383163EA
MQRGLAAEDIAKESAPTSSPTAKHSSAGRQKAQRWANGMDWAKVDMVKCIMGQASNMSTIQHGHMKDSGHSMDNTSLPPINISAQIYMEAPTRSMAVPIFSMTLGALSNIAALFILVKSYTRFRRRSKATFLFLASSLVLTDFAGHIIPGALVLRFYSGQVESSSPTCQLLGGSLVFFGLCPLFFGGAMAVERCVGITKPLLHSSLVTSARTKLAVGCLWATGGIVALLPFIGVGRYSMQQSKTWCFISMGSQSNRLEDSFALIFLFLGIITLLVSLICNTISGVSLIQARIKKRNCNRRAKSHDIEMVVQLVGIMLVSCVCWTPMLTYSTVTGPRTHAAQLTYNPVCFGEWEEIGAPGENPNRLGKNVQTAPDLNTGPRRCNANNCTALV